jgi:hypothetical protein
MNKICTSLEQSKKLIELGIDAKTADICWSIDIPDLPTLLAYPITDCDNWENKIPAWSLSALLELIPPYLGEFNDGIDFGFSKSMNGKWYSAHYIQLDNSGLATFTKTVTGNTAIDAAFEMIVWLKENGKL